MARSATWAACRSKANLVNKDIAKAPAHMWMKWDECACVCIRDFNKVEMKTVIDLSLLPRPSLPGLRASSHVIERGEIVVIITGPAFRGGVWGRTAARGKGGNLAVAESVGWNNEAHGCCSENIVTVTQCKHGDHAEKEGSRSLCMTCWHGCFRERWYSQSVANI